LLDLPENESFQTSINAKRLTLAAKKIEQEEYADAEKLLKRFLENAENSSDHQQYQIIEAKMILALCFEGQKRFLDATQLFTQLLDLKDSSVSQAQMLHLKYRLAECLFQASESKKALPHALNACEGRHLLGLKEPYYESCLLLARIYSSLDESAEAELYLDEVPPDHHSRSAPVGSSIAERPVALNLVDHDTYSSSSVAPGSLRTMGTTGPHCALAMYSVSFSPDGQTLASGCHDETVKVWNFTTGTLKMSLEGHEFGVRSVAFAPNGQTLASASLWSIIFWDTATGTRLRTLTGHDEEHIREVESVAFSPDSLILASTSRDHTIKLWWVATGKLHKTLEGHKGSMNSAVFSPDGLMLASASDDHTVKLWDPVTGELRRTIEGQYMANIYSIAFSPDSQTLAFGSASYTIRLWQILEGKFNKTWGTAMAELSMTLEGYIGTVLSIAFSPDGQTIATASATEVRLWNAATGKIVQTMSEHSNSVYSVAFSPDGRTLASASADETVKLWEIRK
jgi:WD40 repeat protein